MMNRKFIKTFESWKDTISNFFQIEKPRVLPKHDIEIIKDLVEVAGIPLYFEFTKRSKKVGGGVIEKIDIERNDDGKPTKGTVTFDRSVMVRAKLGNSMGSGMSNMMGTVTDWMNVGEITLIGQFARDVKYRSSNKSVWDKWNLKDVKVGNWESVWRHVFEK